MDGDRFTGSVSLWLSNKEMREFVGGIDVVSVGKSRSVTDEAVLSPPSLSARLRPLICICPELEPSGCPVLFGFGLGLGLADLLAARVAAMNEVDRGSGPLSFGGRR